MTTSPTNIATHAGRSQRVTWLWLALPLGWLWWHLIRHLQVEWTLNPQYGYGWAVPFLCAYLISRKLGAANASEATGPAADRGGNKIALACLAGLAMLYAPTRLIEEANPEWRLISWALAGETVGLTGLVLYLWLGGRWLRRLAFPVIYFLVAVPWPTWLEVTVIQGLTRADAALTVELLNGLGIPAMPHGNVIEVATGEVGIDEACSGIRSFHDRAVSRRIVSARARAPTGTGAGGLHAVVRVQSGAHDSAGLGGGATGHRGDRAMARPDGGDDFARVFFHVVGTGQLASAPPTRRRGAGSP
jgi:exosortase